MENHAKYGDTIYFHDEDSLYVNLFIASELAWPEKGLSLRQETQFPAQDTTRLKLKLPKAASPGDQDPLPRLGAAWHGDPRQREARGHARKTRLLRHDPARVARRRHGGRPAAHELAERVSPRRSEPRSYSLRPHRPGRGNWAPKAWRTSRLLPAVNWICPTCRRRRCRVCSSARRICLRDVEPVAGSTLKFRTQGIGRPHDVTLIPYYLLNHQRYAIYWQLYTPEGWQARQAEIAAAEARRKALEARIVDQVMPGNPQSETDHKFRGERTNSGDFQLRKWRDARGWFSWQLKVLPGDSVVLRCTYWGGDLGHGREFDVLVDGHKVAEETVRFPSGSSLTSSTQSRPS